MVKVVLINKEISRIIVFELLQDVMKPSPSIDVMRIVMDVFISELINQF